MDDLLRACHRQAEQRWPGVSLPFETFCEHVEERADGRDPESLSTDDLYLALACARGDTRAIAHFEESVLARIHVVLRRVDPRPDFVDEIRQTLRERLLVSRDGAEAKLLDYSGRGPLSVWVNVTAIRTALNARRGEARKGKHFEVDWGKALAAADTGDPELEAFKAKHREQFEQAIASACAELDERQKTLLRLHFLDGLSVDRIGKVYGVHKATAARWVVKARDRLHAATREHLVRDHGIPPSQLSFIERLVLSQLSVCFSQLLNPAPEE